MSVLTVCQVSFYLIIGIAVSTVSLYGPGYVHTYDEKEHPFAVLGLFTGLFVSGMLLVLLADDAFFFMIAWELMSVASYFLVAFQHENSANRRAAFLYLLMAEVGALAIILGFGVLASFSDGFTFDALRDSKLSTTWASIAFVSGLVGFWHESRNCPDTCLVTGSASGSAVTYFRVDERRDAESCALRIDSFLLRLDWH